MKKSFVLVLLAVFSLSLVSVAFAESCQTEEAGKSVTGFLKKSFNYPGKAVKETAGMTASTLQNTGEKVVSKTGENTEAVLKGDLAKTGNLVADNVKGTAETAGQTVSETAQVPVKSAEDDKQTA